MTVIRPNSVSGINSITAQANEIKIFKSDGTQGGLMIDGANLNATSGISTVAALTVTGNVSVGGTLTYQDVTNIDSVGIITARAGIDVTSGNVDIGGATHSRNLTVHDATNSVILIEGASNGTSNLMFADENDEDVGMLGYNHASNYLAFTVNAAERLRITSTGGLESYSASDTNPNFKFRSDDTNWHGYLNQTVHGATISTILSCGGTWTVDGTTYAATKDYNGSFGTAALIVHNQYNSTATGGELVFVTKANGSSTTDGAVTERFRIDSSGHVLPGANNTYDLGSTAKGWRNVYMNDLNLSNMNGDTNDVDGTQGSWTIQEGKDDLYIINRLNGKKFKIKMEEIS